MVKTACLESRRSRVRAPLWYSSSKETSFLSAHSQRFNSVESLRDREVACSASDRQGSNNESCLEGSVISFILPPSAGSSAQFSLYVHTRGLKPHSLPLGSITNYCSFLSRDMLCRWRIQGGLLRASKHPLPLNLQSDHDLTSMYFSQALISSFILQNRII